MAKIQRALISVSDKAGLSDFARALAEFGVELLSTGGTAKLLRDSGLEVVQVSEYTGQPEILDGRVKTLHPKVHGGLLAIRDDPEHQKQLAAQGFGTIDLVVVNLYPFEATVAKPGATFAEAIENIDIGGPAMVRSAAKNHAFVTVIVDPADYARVLEEMRASGGSVSAKTNRELAKKVYRLTAHYDGAIADYLGALTAEDGARRQFGETLHLELIKAQDLRYGENPHQQAAFYREAGDPGPEPSVAKAKQIQGKELSFNNLVDANAALELVKEFRETVAVAIKHTNPCGVATSKVSLADAFRKCRACDPVSIFGGIVGVNREVDAETAEQLKDVFLEIVIAPAFSREAKEMFASSKRLANVRLLEVPFAEYQPGGVDMKKVVGGMLVQDRDLGALDLRTCKVLSKRPPTDSELRALDFAWKVCKHAKSNTIVLAREDSVVGVGAGQMSRVDSARLAVMRAETHKLATQGTVVASDAFFPFPDALEVCADAGATAVAHPGGSIRDQEVVDAADRRGMAMVLTGMRHFRH
jgi:phosphoribosylaminoimidazolecarboxamide formyltransferase / IMP cyclohydrolase